MTAQAASGRCPHSEHHSHRRTEDEPLSYKIPKAVNAFLDRCARDPGLTISAATYVAALLAVWLLPAWSAPLACAGAGVYLGWFLRSPGVGRLREERDDALRQNGKLRHDNAVLMRGQSVEDAQPTRFLPRIGDGHAS